MIRTTVILSVVAAFIAVASATPSEPLVGVTADYIGTDDISAQNALNDAVDLNGLWVHDLVQDVDVASDADENDINFNNRGSGHRMNRVDSGNRGNSGNRGSSGNSGSSCGSGCGHDHGLLDHLLNKREEPTKGQKKMFMRRKAAARKN